MESSCHERRRDSLLASARRGTCADLKRVVSGSGAGLGSWNGCEGPDMQWHIGDREGEGEGEEGTVDSAVAHSHVMSRSTHLPHLGRASSHLTLRLRQVRQPERVRVCRCFLRAVRSAMWRWLGGAIG